jgi:transposase
MLADGNLHDCVAAKPLLRRLPTDALVVVGRKGYDGDAVRDQVEALGALPNIPPKSTLRHLGMVPAPCRNRNAIECTFGRLEDFRRIATRDDRKATSFIAATVSPGYESEPRAEQAWPSAPSTSRT